MAEKNGDSGNVGGGDSYSRNGMGSEEGEWVHVRAGAKDDKERREASGQADPFNGEGPTRLGPPTPPLGQGPSVVEMQATAGQLKLNLLPDNCYVPGTIWTVAQVRGAVDILNATKARENERGAAGISLETGSFLGSPRTAQAPPPVNLQPHPTLATVGEAPRAEFQRAPKFDEEQEQMGAYGWSTHVPNGEPRGERYTRGPGRGVTFNPEERSQGYQRLEARGEGYSQPRRTAWNDADFQPERSQASPTRAVDEEQTESLLGTLKRLLSTAEAKSGDVSNSKPTSSGSGGSGGAIPKQKARPPSIVTESKGLHALGKLEKVDSKAPKFKMILNYVRNSLDSSNVKMRLHDVFEISGKGSGKGGGSPPRGGPAGAGAGGKSFKSKEHRMLLWFKTTPDAVKRLSQGKDGFVAFYDRVARALAVRADQLDKPHRQLILLCAVSLGKDEKTSKGYQHWAKIGKPKAGCDTIKAVGRLCPDWKQNEDDNGVLVPAGRTVKRQAELDYNEYIVYECRRVTVKYAVDIEIVPRDDGDGDEPKKGGSGPEE